MADDDGGSGKKSGSGNKKRPITPGMTLRTSLSLPENAAMAALLQATGSRSQADMVRTALDMLKFVVDDPYLHNVLANSLTPIGRSNLHRDGVAAYPSWPKARTTRPSANPVVKADEPENSEQRQKALDWLVQFVTENGIVEDLYQVAAEKNASTDAYQRIIGDLQRKLDQAYAEIGQIDPITRNRKEFLRLLEETFSVKLGPVSLNVKGFMKICRFLFTKKG